MFHLKEKYQHHIRIIADLKGENGYHENNVNFDLTFIIFILILLAGKIHSI
jgi:hypothetical protein